MNEKQAHDEQRIVWTSFEKSCLTGALLSLGLGLAWLSWLKVSPIGTMLFMNYSYTHPEASSVERFNAYWLFALLPLVFLPRWRLLAAAGMGLYLAVFVYAARDQGGEPFTAYAPLSAAMRLATPLVFLMVFSAWWQSLPDALSRTLPAALIAVAAAVAFHMHGVEAILAHPGFIDMTLGVAKTLSFSQIALSETQARHLLIAVGVIDIITALAVLLLRNRFALSWMIIWGLFTAVLRFLNYGTGGLPDAIIRLPHFFLPLALWRFSRWSWRGNAS
jgi:hypothetical protein